MIQIDDITWQSNDGLITFKNMDCNAFMAGCKENEFDLIHNDPPYGIGMHKAQGNTKSKVKVWIGGNWDNETPTKKHWELVFEKSKNQIIWGANYFLEYLKSGNKWIIWDKMLDQDQSHFEIAWTSFVGAERIFRFSRSNLQGFQNPNRFHPTEKPIDLYKYVCDNYTKPTDTILDCFGGSMSNAIACHMKRRKLTIIELDVDYFKSALNRFEIYERQVEDIAEFGFAKTKLETNNPCLF